MKKLTKTKLGAYFSRIQELNAVDSVSEKFNLAPSVQQSLEDAIQESSAFLKEINFFPVDEMEGEKILLGEASSVASNTDTSGDGERQTTDVAGLGNKKYKLYQNNYDSHIRYAKLDLWAKFKDFQKRIANQKAKTQAKDRLRIGFNGTSYAATSNRANNPLLQDVNIGWLQQYRNDAPDRVMNEVDEGTGKVNVYAGGDFENLDALVMDSVNNLIAEWHQEDDELVVICGRGLMADKYFPLVNKNQENSEKLAADLIISQKRMGGLQVVRAPFFPAKTLFITTLSNLSVYFQESGRRSYIENKPSKDRINFFESSNDGYVVEDYSRGCLIENIETVAPAQ